MSESSVAASRATLAYLMLSLTSAMWAGNSIIGRALRDDVSPVTLAFWRWFVTILILAPFVWPELKRAWPIVRRSLGVFVALGLLGTALQSALTFWSLHHTIALHVQLFNSVIPLTVMLGVWMLYGTRPSRSEGVGFLVSLTGVLMIVSHGDLGRIVRLDLNVGDLAALASMMIWGLYTALIQRAPTELSPFAFTFVSGAIGVLAISPLHLVEIARDPGVLAFSPEVLAGILYIGIFASLLATICLRYGIVQIGPSRAGLFTHLVPVFGAVMAVGLLGEVLGWHHLAGFALVLGGIAICNRLGLRSWSRARGQP